MSVNIFKNGILSKIAGAVGDAVPLINNFLTNQAGKGAADANTVYVLNNKIDELNNSLNNLFNLVLLSDAYTSGNITLNDNLSNYKFIYCEIGWIGESNIYGVGTIPLSLFKNGKTYCIDALIVSQAHSMNNQIKITYINDNTIELSNMAEGKIRPVIYGIK